MQRIVLTLLFLTLNTTLAISADVTYTGQIKPLFNAKCVTCHGAESAPEHKAFKMDKEKWLAKGQGMRMDTFSHLIGYIGWPDSGAIMRRLDDGAGKEGKQPGNMYQYLGDDEAERQSNLALFKAWVGNWNLKKFDALSKEDLDGIKVAY